jgi:hypothetical protein
LPNQFFASLLIQLQRKQSIGYELKALD